LVKLGRDFRGKRAWKPTKRTLKVRIKHCLNILSVYGGIIFCIFTFGSSWFWCLLGFLLSLFLWFLQEKGYSFSKLSISDLRNLFYGFTSFVGLILFFGSLRILLLDMDIKFVLLSLFGLLLYTVTLFIRRFSGFYMTLRVLMMNLLLVFFGCVVVYAVARFSISVWYLPLLLFGLVGVFSLSLIRERLIYRRRIKIFWRNFLAILAGLSGVFLFVSFFLFLAQGVTISYLTWLLVLEGVALLVGGSLLNINDYLLSLRWFV